MTLMTGWMTLGWMTTFPAAAAMFVAVAALVLPPRMTVEWAIPRIVGDNRLVTVLDLDLQVDTDTENSSGGGGRHRSEWS